MIPKEIKIGAVTWAVFFEKLKGNFGECDIEKFKISIAPHLAEAGKEATLIHELLHAVCHMAGIGNEKLTEEQFISRIEYTLYSALKENGFWPKE